MNNCLECRKETSNPKFCSSSCAATFNNRKYPKRGSGEIQYCRHCGKELVGDKRGQTYCSRKCFNDYRTKNRPTKDSPRDIEKECATHGITAHRLYKNGKYYRYRCLKCQSEAVQRRRDKLKELAVEYKGGKCIICGYDKYVGAMDFHHTNPDEKDFGMGHNGIMRSWERVKKELDKCILLCANCHREVHAGIVNIPL